MLYFAFMKFKDIGKTVRAARIAKGVSHQTVADETGLTKMTVINIEQGTYPHLLSRKALNAYFGFEIPARPKKAKA